MRVSIESMYLRYEMCQCSNVIRVILYVSYRQHISILIK